MLVLKDGDEDHEMQLLVWDECGIFSPVSAATPHLHVDFPRTLKVPASA